MRVLLIKSDFSAVYLHGPQINITYPPLGLECIAANIEDIADVRIYDNRLNPGSLKDLEKQITQFQPDYVGISCNYTSQIHNARRIAIIAKKHNCQTVIGGCHPTLVYNETLSYSSIDIVIRGEGEITFRELIKKNNPEGIAGLSYKQDGKHIHNPDRKLMDLKKTRIPARHYRSAAAKASYNFFGFPIDCIETSRGCPYTCNFCCIHLIYQKTYRQRKVQDIIRELQSEELNKHAAFVFITDDNFAVNPKFVMELCDAIIKNKIRKYFIAQARVDMIANHPEVFERMAEAGFLFLFLGLESFSDRTLEKLKKQFKFKQIKSAIKILHDFGYIIQGNIILGADLNDTKRDLESTIKITKLLDIELPTFSLLTPFPGTKLMEQVIEENLLLSKDWRKFNWSTPIIKYQNLSSEDLNYYLSKAYRETLMKTDLRYLIKRHLQKRGMKFHLSRILTPSMFNGIPRMIKSLANLVSNRLRE